MPKLVMSVSISVPPVRVFMVWTGKTNLFLFNLATSGFFPSKCQQGVLTEAKLFITQRKCISANRPGRLSRSDSQLYKAQV